MSRTVVTIGDSASAALIDTSVVFKTVLLPTPTAGKFIYVADSNGFAQNSSIWISTNGTGLSIVGSVMGPGGMPVINRNYGAMAFLANGNNWYTIINEGGIDSFATIYTSSIITSSFTSQNVSTTTIWAQTLNLAGGFSPTGGITTVNVSTNTLSTGNVYTAALSSLSISNAGNISTVSLNVGSLSSINISTVNLAAGFISTINLGATTGYITNLFVGTETDGGLVTSQNLSNVGNISNGGVISTLTLGVGGSASISNALNVGGTATLGVTNTASISNSGVISTLGLNVGALSSINISTVNLAAGFISTINLGANSAYITNLFVGTETDGGLVTSQNLSNVGNISNGGVISTLTLGVGGSASISNALNVGGTATLGVTNTASISNSGVISTLGLNVGALSSINISTVNLAAGFISTLNLGANTAYITNLFVGNEADGGLVTSQNLSNINNISNGNTISTLYLGVSGNAYVTSNVSVGANVSSLSLNTGNISSASLYSVNVTNNSSFTASVQGNSISTGKLYASAVYYNVQTL
jgi:fibronectin-binding autotransporter adhesin